MFDTLTVFLEELILKKIADNNKSMKNYPAFKDLNMYAQLSSGAKCLIFDLSLALVYMSSEGLGETAHMSHNMRFPTM